MMVMIAVVVVMVVMEVTQAAESGKTKIYNHFLHYSTLYSVNIIDNNDNAVSGDGGDTKVWCFKQWHSNTFRKI